ncbi:hypothetical protein [Dubosiella newyorkensis]|uniref:hypothetical protein n=1 Tax=Dubosiella newyorkensis TaxID=1862672 RepID=UPI0032B21B10
MVVESLHSSKIYLLKEESFIQGNPLQNLIQQFQIGHLQSAIQKQSELLEKLHYKIDLIQQGLMNDRIALLQSGQNQILFSLNRNESNTNKIIAIEAGIKDMITARDQIFQELKLRINEFTPIPKNIFKRGFQHIIKKEYLEEKTNEYKKIVAIYELFERATMHIAVAHLLIDQAHLINYTYQNSIDMMKKIDYSNIRSIEIWYPRDKYCGLLYYEWEQLLENDKKECIKLKEKKENIAIEFQGELLLEVIENE